MKTASTVLFTVAAELAKLAKEEMPKLQKGEAVIREGLENGVYFRDSIIDGKLFRNQYDFKQRKNCRSIIMKGNDNA